MSTPRVTVAFLSWNRLHYLRATLESARRCIRHSNMEWIVSDNSSEEPGLAAYLASCDWVTHRWCKKQTHADAMNEIVARATGEYLLLWPDDMQFTVEGNWLTRLVETLEANRDIGSVGLNFLRRKTVLRFYGGWQRADVIPLLADLKRGRVRRPRVVRGPEHLHTSGWRRPGVVASGIPSLTRTEYWRALGPWRTASGGTRLLDSSLGAEDFMIAQFQKSGFAWQQALLTRPVAADIINDETGCKAKVRHGKRYGVYTAPACGDFYYEIVSGDVLPPDDHGLPLCFEDYVRPVGFRLPLDARGDLRKASLNESVVTTISP
jgi:hypothetical protein